MLKGSSCGGVAAIFDQVPKIEVFLSYYSDKFTMAGPTFPTGDYGFVLPKNSLLLSDFSTAILNITQGGKMEAIKKTWFGKKIVEPDSSSPDTARIRLSLSCFWGLFLIVGVASFAAVIWFCIRFWIENRNSITLDELGLWQRVKEIARLFNERNSSHIFRKRKSEKEVEFKTFCALATMGSFLSFTASRKGHYNGAITPTLGSSASEDNPSIESLSPMDYSGDNALIQCRDIP
ncbi:hypothetical protein AMTR_s00019p00184550 [Amborella trichopoda]|uniref:Uncharacterized protein n=2 Tax=Amborella trichopoda TaxID=13333 RepID=W1PJG7_AMBTC|nr:hypothetical protein AMTR_s00019p00184550 [Amborella trichopoda]